MGAALAILATTTSNSSTCSVRVRAAATLGSAATLGPETLPPDSPQLPVEVRHAGVYRCASTSRSLVDGSGRLQSKAWANSRSQSQEDRALFENLFSPGGVAQLHGIFVEMGALDGVTYSNSLFFEQSLDWRGVLIEADPTQQTALLKNRPLATSFNVAACPRNMSVQFVPGGAMGVAKSQNMEASIDAWHKGRPTVQVQCIPLMELLSDVGLQWIDLFSLDVEGSELSILQQYDFARIPVRAWVVETSPSRQQYAAIVSLMADNGFGIAPFTTMSYCRPSQDCAKNVVFVNKHFSERKFADVYARAWKRCS